MSWHTNEPNWLNDPMAADDLRERGLHYDKYELDEANGRLNEMGRFSEHQAVSRFLKAEDCVAAARSRQIDPLGWTLDLTIRSVEDEELPRRDGNGNEIKLVAYFQGAEKGLVLNSGNCEVLGQLTGDDTDRAAGLRVTMYLVPVSRALSQCGFGMRLRGAQPTAPAPAPAQPTAPAPATEPAPPPAESFSTRTPQYDPSVGEVPDDEIPF